MLRGRAREEQVSKISQLKYLQAVLSQICDYRPVSIKFGDMVLSW